MELTDVEAARDVVVELEAEMRTADARWRSVRYFLQLAAGIVCLVGATLLDVVERPEWLAVVGVAWVLALAVVAFIALVWWAEHDARLVELHEEWTFALGLHRRLLAAEEV